MSYTYPFQGTYTVRLAAVNNCDADTIEKIINVVAGIDEFLTAATFDIYPNPAIAMLVLSDPFDTVKAVEIISASGKSLCVFNYNGSGHGTQKVIDISALAPGAYYLKAEMKQSIIFKKLIKL
ncbi:MAG: hypothetical protein BWY70_01905 [Bacteroidetes bacterium ADurb.Bin408]|nr:MAG: hypothetical protein BWY70_01905 [Bacteroidetes bacterium ADurb.Bin408]